MRSAFVKQHLASHLSFHLDRASPKETRDHDAEEDNSGAADAEQDDDEEAIQLPSFKKRNADGESPTPEVKKKKYAPYT